MDSHYTSRNGATAVKLVGPELMYVELGDMTGVTEIRFGLGLCIDPTTLAVQNPKDGGHEDTFIGFSGGFTGLTNLPDVAAQVNTASTFIGCGSVTPAADPTGWTIGEWLAGYQNAGRVQKVNYTTPMAHSYTRCTTYMPKVPAGKISQATLDTFPHTQNISFSGHPTTPSVSIYVVTLRKDNATMFTIGRSISQGAGTITTDTGAGQRAVIDAELTNRVNNFWVGGNSSVYLIQDQVTCSAGVTPESVIQALKCAVIQWPLTTTPLYIHNMAIKKIIA